MFRLLRTPRPVRVGRPGLGRPGLGKPGQDDGFTLLETIVSISLITIIVAALTTLFVNTISSVDHLRTMQSGSAVLTSGIDNARSVGGRAAPKGRDAGSVTTQFNRFVGTPVEPWLTEMTQSIDANPSGPADLPTAAETRTVNGVTYTVNYLVGTCHRKSADSADSQDCTNDAKHSGTEYVDYVRVVVAVGWKDTACAGDTCFRVSAVLLNDDIDPQFNSNTEPPPVPKLTECQDQTVAVGEAIDLPVHQTSQTDEAAAICTLTDGVPNFTWSASELPDGLKLDQEGHVTGTVAAPGDGGELPRTVNSQITVTDAFLRPSTGNTFQWTVREQPTTTSGDTDPEVGEPSGTPASTGTHPEQP